MAQGDEAAHFDGGAAALAAEHQIGEAAPATRLKRLPKEHPARSLAHWVAVERIERMSRRGKTSLNINARLSAMNIPSEGERETAPAK